MIDITSDNNVDENGPETPSAMNGAWEAFEVPQQDASSWAPPSDTQDPACEGSAEPALGVLEADAEPEAHPRDPLEWYLMKLLAPIEDAPPERVPRPADETPLDELPAPEELDTAVLPEPPEAAEESQGTRPLWRTTEADVSETPAAAAGASPAASLPPAGAKEASWRRKRESSKPKKRLAIRARKEKTGGNRQKLMTALIPVLAIAMVVVLKNPFGARPTVKAASEQPAQIVRPVSTDVQIAWEIPSPYDPAGRDLMKGTPPPVVAVEGNGAAPAEAEPIVELAVTGILYSQDNPAAIVDTQVVHEGQQISGATVMKIEKDGIQFEKNGRRWKQTVTQQ